MFFWQMIFFIIVVIVFLVLNTGLSKARPAWPKDSYAKKINPDINHRSIMYGDRFTLGPLSILGYES
jgi:hypothetical protein